MIVLGLLSSLYSDLYWSWKVWNLDRKYNRGIKRKRNNDLLIVLKCIEEMDKS